MNRMIRALLAVLLAVMIPIGTAAATAPTEASQPTQPETVPTEAPVVESAPIEAPIVETAPTEATVPTEAPIVEPAPTEATQPTEAPIVEPAPIEATEPTEAPIVEPAPIEATEPTEAPIVETAPAVEIQPTEATDPVQVTEPTQAAEPAEIADIPEPTEPQEQGAPILLEADTDIRRLADGMSEILLTVPAGTQVESLSEEGEWQMVRFDGVTGYIYQEQAPEAGPEQPPIQVTVFSSRRSVVEPGETIRLTSAIQGSEGYETMLQWQWDRGQGFEDVPEANGEEYSFEASAETLSYRWRLVVYYR